MPKLDEVPRKRRKLLNASTTATATVRAKLPQLLEAIEVQPPAPSASVEEMAPLAMEEASPMMPEARSPTLMIQDMLGELAHEGEAAEAPGIV